MRHALRKVFYTLYRPLSGIHTHFFSAFLANWGYFIRSEHLYNHTDATVVEDRIEMHHLASTQTVSPAESIHFMEFGVYKGTTFYIWVKNNTHPASTFSGFDTFTGLPENWGKEKKGNYSAGGLLPDINDGRVGFYKGLIQDTLPVYVSNMSDEKRKVIHIDVDLYNASLFTLLCLQPFLRRGDILIFDDFFTVTKASYEFRAFADFLSLYKIAYKPLIKCRRGHYVIEIQ